MKRTSCPLMLLVIAACASQPAPPSKPVPSAAPDDDLVGLLPAFADIIMEIEGSRLQAWKPLQAIVGTFPAEQRAHLDADFGFDWLTDVDRVALATTRAPKPDLLVLARGRFDGGHVWAAGQARGLRPGNHRGVAMLEADSGAIAFLTPRTLALGSRLGVRTAIDVLGRVVPSVRSQATMMDAWNTLSSGNEPAVRMAAVLSELLRRDLERELQMRAQIRRLGSRLELSEAFDLAIVGEFDTPAHAAEWTSELKARVGELRHQLGPLGFDGYFDGLVVDAQGPRATVSVRLSDRQVADLVQAAGTLLHMGAFRPFRRERND